MSKQSDLNEVVILFAGDSGDGIQLTGGQFTETVELGGLDISTFPNYPADIRAPQGTLSGVSGFQLKMGAIEVYTPGDEYDVLVAMNAAALKVNLSNLKKRGIIIANTSGFDQKNLKLAQYIDNENPLTDHSLDDYELHAIDITRFTRETLKDSDLNMRDIDRCKNMFVLGFIYWMFSQDVNNSVDFIGKKFKSKPVIADANIKVLKAGYNFGDTLETFTSRFELKPAKLPKGKYRNISGNQAVALSLIAAAKKNNLELFYGSYPITPASEVLQELSKFKNFKVKTFQAEDEIAAICSTIGASFGGHLSATATSGPGMALKSEALGLAVMLELPLVIVNVQRGGPSTGMPTKTEQSDLLQAFYGRSGEAPLPILATCSPNDAFDTVYEASRLALEHMTPVIVLSDGYIANGAEPWKYPKASELRKINPPFVSGKSTSPYLPYARNEQLIRSWAPAGTKGFEHRIGGLEKEKDTGKVSYDPDNHEEMVKIRAEKIDNIKYNIPDQEFARGSEDDEILVLGWGSTYGSIETAVNQLREDNVPVAHVHIRHLNPFPINLGKILEKFDKILLPEMNNGQLSKIIRDEFLIKIEEIKKIKGLPFTVNEIKNSILTHLDHVKH